MEFIQKFPAIEVFNDRAVLTAFSRVLNTSSLVSSSSSFEVQRGLLH